MKTPIVIEIGSSNPQVTAEIQRGLQNLVNNVPLATMVDVAKAINKNPKIVSEKIGMINNPLVRKLMNF